MRFIDTHAHLYSNPIHEQLAGIVKNALDQGIDTILMPAIDSGTLDAMLAFAKEYPYSVYTNNVKLKLGDLLFERIDSNGLINDYQLFIDLYKQHYRFTEINEKLQNLERLIYKNAVDSYTYSSLKYYLDKFPFGKYSNFIKSEINHLYKISEDEFLINGMKIIRNFHEVDSLGIYDYIICDSIENKKKYIKYYNETYDWDEDGILDKLFEIRNNYNEKVSLIYLTNTKKLIIIKPNIEVIESEDTIPLSV